MTPDCKWASSTSAVSPPLFCRRSLSLFKTPTAQTSFFRPAPPMADITFPEVQTPQCTQPTPWGRARAAARPVSAPGRGQTLHTCSSCLLIPPPLLYNLHWKKHKENKNSLSTLILESSPSFSVPRGCQSMCPPRGFKLAPSVWEAPPLAPCMGGLLAIQVSP